MVRFHVEAQTHVPANVRPNLTVFELSGTDPFINITASTCGYPAVTS